MTKVFRPFWTLKLGQTEAWLTRMAARGKHLAELNTSTGIFVFQTGEPRAGVYAIFYDRTLADIPQAMAEDGWVQVFHQGNWLVAVNSKPSQDIIVFPSRVNYTDRLLSLINKALLVWHVLAAAVMLGVAVYAVMLVNKIIPFDPPPSWFIPALICIGGIDLVLFFLANKLLHKRYFSSLDRELPYPYDSIITRRKPGWVFAPDKLERWLENMELKGYYLNCLGGAGNAFYFTRGRRRTVKCCADFQLMADCSYFYSRTAAGWSPIFTSIGSFAKWTIWVREYSQDQEPEEMYSDNFLLLRKARQGAIYYLSLFGPLLILHSAVVWGMYRMGVLDPIIQGLYGLLVVIYVVSFGRLLLYCRRRKKQSMGL